MVAFLMQRHPAYPQPSRRCKSQPPHEPPVVAAAGIYKRTLQQALLPVRIPEAGSNKQTGCAVFINGLPVNTITTSPLILSEVEVEIRGRGRGSRSGSGRGRWGLANIKQDEGASRLPCGGENTRRHASSSP